MAFQGTAVFGTSFLARLALFFISEVAAFVNSNP